MRTPDRVALATGVLNAIDVPLVRRVVRWESARGQVGRVAAGAARVLALV